MARAEPIVGRVTFLSYLLLAISAGLLVALIAALAGWLRVAARGDKLARQRTKELLERGEPIELPPPGEPEEGGV